MKFLFVQMRKAAKKTNIKNKTKTKPRAVFESYLKSEAA